MSFHSTVNTNILPESPRRRELPPSIAGIGNTELFNFIRHNLAEPSPFVRNCCGFCGRRGHNIGSCADARINPIIETHVRFICQFNYDATVLYDYFYFKPINELKLIANRTGVRCTNSRRQMATDLVHKTHEQLRHEMETRNINIQPQRVVQEPNVVPDDSYAIDMIPLNLNNTFNEILRENPVATPPTQRTVPTNSVSLIEMMDRDLDIMNTLDHIIDIPFAPPSVPTNEPFPSPPPPQQRPTHQRRPNPSPATPPRATAAQTPTATSPRPSQIYTAATPRATTTPAAATPPRTTTAQTPAAPPRATTNQARAIQSRVNQVNRTNAQLNNRVKCYNPITNITVIQCDEYNTEIDECPICYECTDKSTFIKTDCNHDFCFDCVKRLIQTKNIKTSRINVYDYFTLSLPCPMCRNDIKTMIVQTDNIIEKMRDVRNKYDVV